jgi:hypothetical protein
LQRQLIFGVTRRACLPPGVSSLPHSRLQFEQFFRTAISNQ